LAEEVFQTMHQKYPEADIITDNNLRIEKSRMFFGDFFLHYPSSYF
jgi:hypothetical protein